jgi:hypothetical protein
MEKNLKIFEEKLIKKQELQKTKNRIDNRNYRLRKKPKLMENNDQEINLEDLNKSIIRLKEKNF